MEHVSLNSDKVKQATNSSSTATTTMVLLAIRQRARNFTSMGKIKNQLLQMGETVVDKDYKTFWKDLENAGAGSIILGRRGRETRFEWSYSLKDVAKIAIEGHESEIQRLDKKRNKKPNLAKAIDILNRSRAGSKSTVKYEPSKQEKLVYRIPIRPDFTLEVNLPTDVSREELQKIGNSFFPIEAT